MRHPDPRLPASATREINELNSHLRRGNFEIREGKKYGHVPLLEHGEKIIEEVKRKAWALVRANGKRDGRG